MGSPLFKYEQSIIDLIKNPKVASVYILGDVFDTWEHSIRRTVRRRKKLIDVINECGKVEVILKGNHDPDIDTLKKVFPKVYVTDIYETELFKKSVVMLHGHQFDSSIDMGKVLFPIQFIAERFGFNSKAWLRHALYSFDLWRKKANNNSIVLPIEEKIVENYIGKYDIIMSGHTHIGKLVQEKDFIYANSGNMIYKPKYLIAEKNLLYTKELR
jgi:metallophosphoesterase superfamily enzyme